MSLKRFGHVVGLLLLLEIATAFPTQGTKGQTPGPELNSAWAASLQNQLSWWETQYPNQHLSFIVIRLGVRDGVEKAQEVAWTLSSQWQRPVIALPTFNTPNSFINDSVEATANYVLPGSVPDDGVQILNIIGNHGHLISELHFFSGSVVALNAERMQYSAYFNNSRNQSIGPQTIVGFGAKISSDTMSTVKPFGGSIRNIGHDFVYAMTDPTLKFLDPFLANRATSALGAWLVGPAHDILKYETDYGITNKLKLQGNQALAPPKALQPTNSPAPGTPGGIDFSNFQISYLSEKPATTQTPYVFSTAFGGNLASTSTPKINTALAARYAWDSFFVWLSLSSDKFWVNLNPNEPDRIIDPQMGTTDAGRIMLEADFQMKRTVAQLIDPRTADGRKFWDEMDELATQDAAAKGIEKQPLCFSFRQWIVPGEITAWGNENSIYIVNAKLDVKLESQYLEQKGQTAGSGCSKASESLTKNLEALFIKEILPQVIDRVNNAPEYADLRNIYRMRIVAEWYKTRHASAGDGAAFAQFIGTDQVTNWPSVKPWSATDIFNRYKKSLEDGEFSVEITTTATEDAPNGGKNIIKTKRTYIFGGVDFTDLQLNLVPFVQLLGNAPDAAKKLSAAFFSPGGYIGPNEGMVGETTVANGNEFLTSLPIVINPSQLENKFRLIPLPLNCSC